MKKLNSENFLTIIYNTFYWFSVLCSLFWKGSSHICHTHKQGTKKNLKRLKPLRNSENF